MNIIKMSIMCFTIVGILFVSSCSKQDSEEKTIENNEIVMSAEDIKTEQMILAFKQKIENPSKDDDPMQLDSVVWYLESNTNYTYSNLTHEYKDLHTGKSIISVPITDGMVLMTDVAAAYNHLIDSITEDYYAVSGEKYFLSADVSIAEEQKSGSFVVLEITSATGEKGIINPLAFFDEDDWWRAGLLQGKAEPETYEMTWEFYDEKDAATEFQQK